MPGQLVFPGVNLFKIIDDDQLEHNEPFTITATVTAQPEGSRDATATVTIVDNDGRMLIYSFLEFTFAVNIYSQVVCALIAKL